ncbi:hypothetical protein BC826DRAFT_1020496, partial [Russula brevipes]
MSSRPQALDEFSGMVVRAHLCVRVLCCDGDFRKAQDTYRAAGPSGPDAPLCPLRPLSYSFITVTRDVLQVPRYSSLRERYSVHISIPTIHHPSALSIVPSAPYNDAYPFNSFNVDGLIEPGLC